MKYHVLYNTLSGNGKAERALQTLGEKIGGENLARVSVLEIENYADFFSAIPAEDKIILCGGDGTLNRFANAVRKVELKHEIYYFACGSGNDFLRDIEGKEDELVPLNEYLKDLPVVTVNGREYVFLNGVGYGIDGYCCEEGDKQRLQSTKPVDYTGIAIKGLLFHYKPTKATVIVDGTEYCFDNVWLAPTMFGRYYGGGMMPAPEQARDQDHVSVMAYHGASKIKVLVIFPNLFKGEHVKSYKHVSVFSGKEITVKFDEPRTLQIDGETVFNVTEYTVRR